MERPECDLLSKNILVVLVFGVITPKYYAATNTECDDCNRGLVVHGESAHDNTRQGEIHEHVELAPHDITADSFGLAES